MEDEYGNEHADDEESGSSLRRKLESTLAQNKELTERVATFEAARVISDNGFDLVNPDELKGVALDELEARAKAMQEERVEVAQRFLSERLGVAEDQVSALLAGDTASKDAFDRVRKANSVSGEPVRDNPMEGVTPGVSRLRAAFAAKSGS